MQSVSSNTFALLRAVSLLLTVGLAPPASAALPDLAQLKLAAESGDAVAQFEYGQRINFANPKERIEWTMKSAEQGYAPAQDAAAEIFERLALFEPKKKFMANREAARWASRAAFQGFASAQSRLGDFYARGTGVAQNVVTAYMWKQITLQNPAVDLITHSMAKSQLDSIIANTTSENIQEGQRRAAEFKLPRVPDIDSVEADLVFVDLKLTAILQSKDQLSAVLNNVRFTAGETKDLKMDEHSVRLTCFAVFQKAARFGIAGTNYDILLPLKH
jgi:hypothetical protein